MSESQGEEEVVPLTAQEQVDLLEAYRYMNPAAAGARGGMDPMAAMQAFAALSRIMAAHGFDPSSGTVSWEQDGPVVSGRRVR